MGNWQLVKINGEYYAERKYKSGSGKSRTQIFEDWNGKDLSLSSDKDFASYWVDARNRIESVL
jgi:hypothetical protein